MTRHAIVAIALLLIGVQSLHAQPTREFSEVVNDVLSTSEWAAEVDQCPSELVPAEDASDGLGEDDCVPGELESCLSRCREGVPSACYWLGYALQKHEEGKQAAEVLYQRSCKLGVPSGCTNRAAGIFMAGLNEASAQACAARTFKNTCALDDPWGCTMYALHLSRGLGVPKDRDQALVVLEKSCRYGAEDDACIRARALREDILGVTPTTK